MKATSPRHYFYVGSFFALSVIVACADQRGFRPHKTTMQEVLEGEALNAQAEGGKVRSFEDAKGESGKGMPIAAPQDAHGQASEAVAGGEVRPQGGSSGGGTRVSADPSATTTRRREDGLEEQERVEQQLERALKESAARAAANSDATPAAGGGAAKGASRAVVPGASAANAVNDKKDKKYEERIIEIIENLNLQSSIRDSVFPSMSVTVARPSGDQSLKVNVDIEVALKGGNNLSIHATGTAKVGEGAPAAIFQPELMEVQRILQLGGSNADVTSQYKGDVKLFMNIQADGPKSTYVAQFFVLAKASDGKKYGLVARFGIGENLKAEFIGSTSGRLKAFSAGNSAVVESSSGSGASGSGSGSGSGAPAALNASRFQSPLLKINAATNAKIVDQTKEATAEMKAAAAEMKAAAAEMKAAAAKIEEAAATKSVDAVSPAKSTTPGQ